MRLSPVRGVVAIRIPSAWEVKSVSFSGEALNGVATESAVMEGVYATEWETTPGVGHNGHKDGYEWWVGYSPASSFATGDSGVVAISIDSHGHGGTYLLDLAFGVAAPDEPEDPDDKALWQIGSAGLNPTGVMLDRSITLYSFTDVPPADSYFPAIQGLGALDVVHGYGPGPDGSYEFRPANVVTRAQFAKLICGALNAAGVPGFAPTEAMEPPVNFRDLGADDPLDLYPHEYVWTAWDHGIVKGYSSTSFRPYEHIQRGHVITMTVRALRALDDDPLREPPADFVPEWGSDMLAEHKANARIAEYNHLLDGVPLADGVAPMPRQEVAQVMWNVLDLLTGP